MKGKQVKSSLLVEYVDTTTLKNSFALPSVRISFSALKNIPWRSVCRYAVNYVCKNVPSSIFIIANRLKQLQCLSVIEWIKLSPT